MLKIILAALFTLGQLFARSQTTSDISPSVGFYPNGVQMHSNVFIAYGHIFLPVDKPHSWHIGRDANRRTIESYSVRVTSSADTILYFKSCVKGEKFPDDLIVLVDRYRSKTLQVEFFDIQALMDKKRRVVLPKAYVVFLRNGG